MQLPAKKNVSTACCRLWQWRPFGFWWAMWSPLCTEELTCFISCICKRIKELRLSCACTMHLLYAVNCKAYFWELRGIPFHCLTSFSFVIQKRTHVDFFFGRVVFCFGCFPTGVVWVGCCVVVSCVKCILFFHLGHIWCLKRLYQFLPEVWLSRSLRRAQHGKKKSQCVLSCLVCFDEFVALPCGQFVCCFY